MRGAARPQVLRAVPTATTVRTKRQPEGGRHFNYLRVGPPAARQGVGRSLGAVLAYASPHDVWRKISPRQRAVTTCIRKSMVIRRKRVSRGCRIPNRGKRGCRDKESGKYFLLSVADRTTKSCPAVCQRQRENPLRVLDACPGRLDASLWLGYQDGLLSPVFRVLSAPQRARRRRPAGSGCR